MSTSETETETEETQSTAGELLKQLREEKEMSIEDVSEKIHLEPRIIEALEANNFEVLPAATYARGYLRSYAKLLGADAEKIISLYNNDAPEEPEVIPEIKHPTQTSSTDRPVKAFSYLVTLILFLLIIAWWQSDLIVSNDGTNNPETLTATVVSDEPNTEEEIISPIEESDTSLNEQEQEGETIELTTSNPLDENLEPPLEVSSLTEVPEVEDTNITTPRPDIDAENTNENIISLEGRDIIDKRGEGPDEIAITLSADSWVEVFESGGDKLYLNLARNGQTLILRGLAPFSVLLGFSQGAEITFNDKQIDHAAYSRAGIARFNVDSEGASERE